MVNCCYSFSKCVWNNLQYCTELYFDYFIQLKTTIRETFPTFTASNIKHQLCLTKIKYVLVPLVVDPV